METETGEAAMIVADTLDDANGNNGRSKRVRKTKTRLEDEDSYLNDALGLNKKKRPKKEVVEVSQFQNANANASVKRYKPKKVDETKRLSANMIAIKALEELSDRSLKMHLSVLRYFLTPRVIGRLESVGVHGKIEEDEQEQEEQEQAEVETEVVAGCGVEYPQSTAVVVSDAVTTLQDTDVAITVTNGDEDDNAVLQPSEVSTSVMDVVSDADTVVKNENEDIVADLILKQPASIKNVKMRPYQLEGLQWLVDHYKRGINCILADGKLIS